MFYYSETKYLHELEEGIATAGIKGFVKITFREQKGTVLIHIEDKSGTKPRELEMTLYEMSADEALHPIAEMQGKIERGTVQFAVNLVQVPFSDAECWFGCLIHTGGKWYGEEGDYWKEIYEEAVHKPQEVQPPKKAEMTQETPKQAELQGENLKETGIPQETSQEEDESEREESARREEETGEENREGRTLESEEDKDLQENSRLAQGAERREENNQTDENSFAGLKTGSFKRLIEGAEYSDKLQNREQENWERGLWKSIYVTELAAVGEKNREWERYGQNSFLLHGFYNYKHLVATEEFLGVPGNYYDKEKQVAAMFGFQGFLPVKELEPFLAGETIYVNRQIAPGTFGYYFTKQDNPHSLNAPQGDRGKVRFADRGKGF